MANFNTPTMGTYGSTWQCDGYSGCGNVADLIGTLRGRPAIVCGNAEGVFAELDRALRVLADPVIFGVNDVGMYLEPMHHWVSLHADNIAGWKVVRWLHHKYQEDVKIHSTRLTEPVHYAWDLLTPVFALSGYFAMQIAYIMGAESIVLCGCPGNPARRFFEREPRKNFGYGGGTAGSDKGIKEQLVKEMHRLPQFRSKVRSMSGFTQQFFGGI